MVARHAAAAVTGLQAAGVAACAKHFPGHGSTRIDSHVAIAIVAAPMDLLARRDLPPFAAAIKAGVRAVMPGHLRVPGLTGDLPASLSRAATVIRDAHRYPPPVQEAVRRLLAARPDAVLVSKVCP